MSATEIRRGQWVGGKYVGGTPMALIREILPPEEIGQKVKIKVGPGWIEYSQYLQTDHWRERHRTALRRAGLRCQLCAREQSLGVHHNSYTRIGAERVEDLFVVCDPCHDHAHVRRSSNGDYALDSAPEMVRVSKELTITFYR